MGNRIIYHCPDCGQKIKFKNVSAGNTAVCGNCSCKVEFIRISFGRIGFTKLNTDSIKEAEIIVNTHSYKICELCQADEKRECKCYCLPAEMFALLVDEKDQEERLKMIENVEELFIDQ